MAFDIKTAKVVGEVEDPRSSGGFDLSTAKTVGEFDMSTAQKIGEVDASEIASLTDQPTIGPKHIPLLERSMLKIGIPKSAVDIFSEVARAPERKLKEYAAQVPGIAESQAKGPMAGAIRNVAEATLTGGIPVSTIGRVGLELGAGALDPENLVIAGMFRAIGKAAMSPLGQKTIGKAYELIPDFVKRLVTYRAFQPEEYQEVAERTSSVLAQQKEELLGLAKETQSLSNPEKARLYQIMKGGGSYTQREEALRDIAGRMRTVFVDKGKEAVDMGLLDKNTYYKNLETYFPRMYTEKVLKEGAKGTYYSPTRIGGQRFMQRNYDIVKPAIARLDAKIARLEDTAEAYIPLNKIFSVKGHIKELQSAGIKNVDDLANATVQQITELPSFRKMHPFLAESKASGLIEAAKKGPQYRAKVRAQSLIQQYKAEQKKLLDMSDIPVEVRKELGEIESPGFPFAKGAMQLTKDVETAKMFHYLSGNRAISSPNEIAGWVQMADSDKLGRLKGMWVHPEVAEEINQIAAIGDNPTSMIESAHNAYRKYVLYPWKTFKTVLNPATHARNTMSNFMMLDFSGMNPTDIPSYLSRAAKEMIDNTDTIRLLKREGLLGSEFSKEELMSLVDTLDEPLKTGDLFESMGKVYKGLTRKPGEWYQKEEQLFKVAKYLHARDIGMHTLDAIREAEKWGFNYKKIPPAIKFLREVPLGPKFITFTYKALPRVAETMARNPLKVMKYEIAFDALENYAKEELGINDKDYALMKKRMRGKQVLLPFKDNNGNPVSLDLSYILPWGDISESGGWGPLPSFISPSGPEVTAIESVLNKSAYYGRDITKEKGLSGASERAQYFLRGTLPAVTPVVGSSAEKWQSYLQGRPEKYTGAERNPILLALHTIFGLKTTPQDAEQMERLEAIDLKKERARIQSLIFSKAVDKSLTPEERKAEIERLKAEFERIKLDSSYGK